MSARRYGQHLDHYLDFLDIQTEAYERAKQGGDDDEEEEEVSDA